MDATFHSIREILDSGDFARLLGLQENEFLEAKSKPYDLSDPLGRYELAKDISAFANANGGHLLIGPKTTRDPDRATDVIDSLELVLPSAIPVPAYLGPKLSDWRWRGVWRGANWAVRGVRRC